MSTMYDVPIPVGNRILIEVQADQKKAIKSKYVAIPDSVNEDYNKRVLLSTTIGKVLNMGKAALETALLTEQADEILPGHLVLFLQNAGVSFKHNEEGKVYRLLTRGDIMGVVGTTEDGE